MPSAIQLAETMLNAELHRRSARPPPPSIPPGLEAPRAPARDWAARPPPPRRPAPLAAAGQFDDAVESTPPHAAPPHGPPPGTGAAEARPAEVPSAGGPALAAAPRLSGGDRRGGVDPPSLPPAAHIHHPHPLSRLKRGIAAGDLAVLARVRELQEVWELQEVRELQELQAAHARAQALAAGGAWGPPPPGPAPPRRAAAAGPRGQICPLLPGSLSDPLAAREAALRVAIEAEARCLREAAARRAAAARAQEEERRDEWLAAQACLTLGRGAPTRGGGRTMIEHHVHRRRPPPAIPAPLSGPLPPGFPVRRAPPEEGPEPLSVRNGGGAPVPAIIRSFPRALLAAEGLAPSPGRKVPEAGAAPASGAEVGGPAKPAAGRKRKSPPPLGNEDYPTGNVLRPSGKKGRKKENGMPRRPLSAYNIFFSEERERILIELPNPQDDSDDKGDDDSDGTSPPPPAGPGYPTAAHRMLIERRISLPGNGPKRRRHRKTHGKISFRDLAKTIGSRWRELPQERLERYRKLAELDMVRYQEDMQKYRGQVAGVALPRGQLCIK